MVAVVLLKIRKLTNHEKNPTLRFNSVDAL